MNRSTRALALLLALALSACHHAQPKSDDQRTAEGRILPGSVSDAMLPYDTASSEPPAAPRVSTDAPADATPAGADAAGTADSAAAPDAAPTPPPAPAPSP